MSAQHTDEVRRYRILDVVGEGGFGRVYRARLEGAEGFAKEVAIKLLTDLAAPDEILQRFRDESRILGLVRDRAVVTVDPPTRLDGRWAVVMEFVDGTNCHRLLQKDPIPPRPALEIVQEVARALDNVYNQQGPDGNPLELIHRDIKPANIQVTPAGTVKVLDFGIARAKFRNREANTTSAIAGTFGYIAPERLEGLNGPESDVFSLGVVLGTLVIGRRPSAKNKEIIADWIAKHPDLQKVWALVEAMTQVEPSARPTARQVEEHCATLGPTLPGGPLRHWAEKHVEEIATTTDDTLIGNVLTETMATVSRMSGGGLLALGVRQNQQISLRTLAIWSIVGAMSIVVGVAGLGGVLGYIAAGYDTPAEEVATRPVEQPTLVEPTIEPTIEPGIEPQIDPEEPAPMAEKPDAPPAPDVEPEPAVVVAPAEPIATPEPEPVVEVTMTFGSVPLGARISVDGTAAGKVPLTRALAAGSHTITMEYGDERSTKTIQVGPRDAVKYIWRGGEKWQAYY